MKTLKTLALGFSAALLLVAACGDDTGGATGTSNDGVGERNVRKLANSALLDSSTRYSLINADVSSSRLTVAPQERLCPSGGLSWLGTAESTAMVRGGLHSLARLSASKLRTRHQCVVVGSCSQR